MENNFQTEDFVQQKEIFRKVNYKTDLNAKQKENYNFQKISAVLADYGFVTMRLSDDWQGADFIAQHIDGTFMKVQLKGRLEINKKYIGKEIWMCFPTQEGCYLFSHDDMAQWILTNTNVGQTSSWTDRGIYNWPSLTGHIKAFLDNHKLS